MRSVAELASPVLTDDGDTKLFSCVGPAVELDSACMIFTACRAMKTLRGFTRKLEARAYSVDGLPRIARLGNWAAFQIDDAKRAIL